MATAPQSMTAAAALETAAGAAETTAAPRDHIC